MGTLPSIHIFCAGEYCVPYARYAMECLYRNTPEDLQERLRVYVHADAIPKGKEEGVSNFLRFRPGISVMHRCFGIKNPKKIAGIWHQRMVNQVAQRHSHEPNIVVLDADFFLTSNRWVDVFSDIELGTFSLSYEMRTDRYATRNEERFDSIRTYLFSINPHQHTLINQQDFSKDTTATDHLALQFPDARIHLEKVLDSMVSVSLKAQLMGYIVEDVKDRIDGIHIGGVSHISHRKINKGQDETWLNIWRERYLMHEIMVALFHYRGWGNYIEKQYLDRLTSLRNRLILTTDGINEKRIVETSKEIRGLLSFLSFEDGFRYRGINNK